MNDNELKILDYIKKYDFISPEFQNTELTDEEFWDGISSLLKKGVVIKRSCAAIAYELA